MHVLEHVVKLVSAENDLVYDPFMGVGSTGVTAIRNNRQFIGVELDECYYTAADNHHDRCAAVGTP